MTNSEGDRLDRIEAIVQTVAQQQATMLERQDSLVSEVSRLIGNLGEKVERLESVAGQTRDDVERLTSSVFQIRADIARINGDIRGLTLEQQRIIRHLFGSED